MAELFEQSKTEAPTQHRRDEARDQGQVATSTELASSLILLAGLAAIAYSASYVAGDLLETVRVDLRQLGRAAAMNSEEACIALGGVLWKALELLGYIMAFVFVASVAVGVFQSGFQITPQLLAINFERLSPSRGLSKMMSMSSTVRGLVTLGKVVCVFLTGYIIVKLRAPELAALQQMTLAACVAQAWRLVLHLALGIAGTLTVFGLLDYVWQLWRMEQTLRMSKQEVKDEVKQEEGDPQVKARVRRLQREAAAKRMLLDVPKATVVITNPTHLAVALRYDRSERAAPKVLAKGAGFVAQRIVAAARRHGVPVVERKPVAQALFKFVKVGREIPVGLYQVVAEILAYVYRLQLGSSPTAHRASGES